MWGILAVALGEAAPQEKAKGVSVNSVFKGAEAGGPYPR